MAAENPDQQGGEGADCAECGASGAVDFGSIALCPQCYQARASCCAGEFDKEAGS